MGQHNKKEENKIKSSKFYGAQKEKPHQKAF
jgi:hypothetical protein